MTPIGKGFVVQSKRTGLFGIVVERAFCHEIRSVPRQGLLHRGFCCGWRHPVQVVCKPDSLEHADLQPGEHLKACRTACG